MERDTERERVRQAWEEVGREIAPALDAASAVVVIGDDPVAAAEVALGAGRVQGARRRVAIGDLVGEVEPLQALVTGDDPHGLVDSFLYGVSPSDAALECGFADQAHLTRHFKARTGVTPAAFRKG